MTNSCRYYTDRTLGWMLNNKIIVLLSLLSFSLFVSTLAIAGQRNGLSDELNECRQSLISTTEAPTTTVAPADPTTTPAEQTTVPADPTTTPAEQTTVPADPTTTPAEQTTVPADPTTTPAEQTAVPAEPTTTLDPSTESSQAL